MLELWNGNGLKINGRRLIVVSNDPSITLVARWTRVGAGVHHALLTGPLVNAWTSQIILVSTNSAW